MTTGAPTADRRRTNRVVPTLMALLFFGPIALALVMYYVGGDQWRPKGNLAHGILLQQPRTLPTGGMLVPDEPSADFAGKWSLLYVGRGDCDEACKEALYRTRQVRRALGKEMGRVQRFFISTGGRPNPGFLAAEHPGLLVVPDDVSTRDTVLSTLGEFAEGDVFVADPLGNLVLRFPSGTAMKDMHEDLKLLLKASQIG